jgi:hypothetical protein
LLSIDEYPDRLEIAGRQVRRPGLQRNPPQRPPLGLEVSHVVGVAAEEQVVGIAATPHVAAMTDDLALGDRPVSRNPGEAVRQHVSHAEYEPTVAVARCAALPEVAARLQVDLGVVGDALRGRPMPGAFVPLRFGCCLHARILPRAFWTTYYGQWLRRIARKTGVLFAVHCP